MKRLINIMIFAVCFSSAFAVSMRLHFNDGNVDTLEISQETNIYFSDSTTTVTRLIAPANGQINVPQLAEFSWQYVPGREVELLISEEPGFTDSILYFTGIDTNYLKLEQPLDVQKRYYWKVRLNGESLWTAPWYFDTYEPVLPGKISSFAFLASDIPGNIKVKISHNSEIDSFMVVYGMNGRDFTDTCFVDTSDMEIKGLDVDSCYFMKIAGKNGAGTGPLSEVLAASVTTVEDPVLIINGFDRQTNGNSEDFIRQHAEAVLDLGYTLVSATNEAMTDGLLSFPFYSSLIYILGEESTVDESFSNAEQDMIENYLKAGGNLFVSGAEIAWDLDYKGSSSDKAFCHDYLHLAYRQDAPNGATGTYYNVYALGDTIFSDLNSFAFDNGSHGTYNVRYPDVYTPLNDARPFLKYTGCNTGAAGIVYQGMFPGGSSEGKIMVLGFPFETVYPEAARNAIMREFFQFAEYGLDVVDAIILQEHALLPNYPNPFNPRTAISYSISAKVTMDRQPLVELSIYDINGRKVETLVDMIQAAGMYELSWDASKHTSGIYLVVFKVDSDIVDTGKMTLVK